MPLDIAGKKISYWWLVGGGVGVVLVVYLYRRGTSASTATTATTADSSTVDPATGLPYSQDSQIDPLTGMTFLSEAEEYGSVSAAEAAVSSGSAYDPYGDADTSNVGYDAGYSTGYGAYYGTGTPTGASYASNAAWAQAVQTGLSALGYSAETVGSALGLYLNGSALNATQTAIVQTAVAEYGPPPVGSFAIVQSGNGSGGGGGTTVKVPPVTGLTVEQATAVIDAEGLKASGPAGVQGVTHVVTSTTPAEGASVASGSTVKLAYKSESGGSSGSTADVTVPNVVGQEQSKAYGVLSAAGLHPSGPAPVPGKVHTVTAQRPTAGSKVSRNSTVTLTSKTS
jgi:hypothetical protein